MQLPYVTRFRVASLGVVLVLGAVLLGVTATGTAGQPAPRLEYAAKFACGQFDLFRTGDTQNLEGPVKPGNYMTAINVHNPSATSRVQIMKKAVLVFAGPVPVPPDPANMEIPKVPGPFVTPPPILEPDFAMLIDCPDIRTKLLGGAVPPPTFIEGWVVLISTTGLPLDVVGLYTGHTWSVSSSGLPPDPVGFSMVTERVPATSLPAGTPAAPARLP